MENQTAFDLNERLAQWRQALRNRAAISDEDIEELESHLRDGIEALVQARLTGEEAFLVAMHRIGHPSALEQEFQQAKPVVVWRERAQWMVIGVLGFATIGSVASMGNLLTLLSAANLSTNGFVLGWIGLAVQIFLFSAVGWLGLRLLRRWVGNGHPDSGNARRVSMLGLIIFLSLSAVIFRAVNILSTGIAVQALTSRSVAEYFMVTAWGSAASMFGLVLALGVWLARPQRLRKTMEPV